MVVIIVQELQKDGGREIVTGSRDNKFAIFRF